MSEQRKNKFYKISQEDVLRAWLNDHKSYNSSMHEWSWAYLLIISFKQEVLGFLHAQCICSAHLFLKWCIRFGSGAAQFSPSHKRCGTGWEWFICQTPWSTVP